MFRDPSPELAHFSWTPKTDKKIEEERGRNEEEEEKIKKWRRARIEVGICSRFATRPAIKLIDPIGNEETRRWMLRDRAGSNKENRTASWNFHAASWNIRDATRWKRGGGGEGDSNCRAITRICRSKGEKIKISFLDGMHYRGELMDERLRFDDSSPDYFSLPRQRYKIHRVPLIYIHVSRENFSPAREND